MRLTSALPILILLHGVVIGCYPGQIVGPTQTTSVTTLVDSQAPLKAARTFALPDTIIHSAHAQGAGIISHDGDPEILASIRQNLTAMGWREITDVTVERPDVVVLTVVLESTNTGVAYSGWWGDWSYWAGWPPAYGPAWAWGYPVGVTTFQYETGTLVIAMLDILHGNTSTQRVPLLWAGAVNGVLALSSFDDALAGVDQAFAQSPYLERQ